MNFRTRKQASFYEQDISKVKFHPPPLLHINIKQLSDRKSGTLLLICSHQNLVHHRSDNVISAKFCGSSVKGEI